MLGGWHYICLLQGISAKLRLPFCCQKRMMAVGIPLSWQLTCKPTPSPAGIVQAALALRHIIRWRHPKLMTCAHHAVDSPVVYEVGLAGAGSDGFLQVHN